MSMKSLTFLAIVALLSEIIHSSPLPGHVKYDQRQDGDWNVRADLENFVILLIPTSGGSSPAGGLGLLDLITKAIPFRSAYNKRKPVKKEPMTPEVNSETEAFIESKTAPYHVDISKSKANLARLHPQEVQQQEKFLVSPSIALIKPEEVEQIRRRIARGFFLTMPLEVDEIAPKKKNIVELTKKKSEFKKEEHHNKKEEKEKLLLLGAEHEQCGPGYERDAKGICKLKDL